MSNPAPFVVYVKLHAGWRAFEKRTPGAARRAERDSKPAFQAIVFERVAGKLTPLDGAMFLPLDSPSVN
jgi:hypothetical protein